jgi:hypothetical protein
MEFDVIGNHIEAFYCIFQLFSIEKPRLSNVISKEIRLIKYSQCADHVTSETYFAAKAVAAVDVSEDSRK